LTQQTFHKNLGILILCENKVLGSCIVYPNRDWVSKNKLCIKLPWRILLIPDKILKQSGTDHNTGLYSLNNKMTQKINSYKHFAVIDIGAAALRMDIFHWDSPSSRTLKLLNKTRLLPRIGALEQFNIREESIKAVEKAFIEFRNKLSSFEKIKVQAVGTAPFREAKNADSVRMRLAHALGHPINSITGDEEAFLIANGICAFEKDIPHDAIFLDIGGGSTEISIRESNSIHCHSLPLGAIGISKILSETEEKEKISKTDSIYKLSSHINSILNSVFSDSIKSSTIIGSSGTLRVLRNLYAKYKNNTLSESRLPANYTKEALNTLLHLDPESLEAYLLNDKHRKDLVLGGLILLECVLNHFSIQSILVTEYSLRHGLLIELLKEEGAQIKSLSLPHHKQFNPADSKLCSENFWNEQDEVWKVE